MASTECRPSTPQRLLTALARPTFRRPLAVLLAAMLLSFQLGWQVSTTPGASKSTAERYPCENCACACQSAEACWRSCCCHSDAEKITWAKANGVAPPAFVRLAAAIEPPSASCCTKAPSRSSCGFSADADCREADSSAGRRTKLVFGWQAMKCRGISVDVFAGLGVLVPPPRVASLPSPRQGGEVCQLHPTLDSLTVAPPSPPPRG